MSGQDGGPEGAFIVDMRVVRQLVMAPERLIGLIPETPLYVFQGDLAQPRSVLGLHFGAFVDFDATMNKLTYRIMGGPQITKRRLSGGAVLLEPPPDAASHSGLHVPGHVQRTQNQTVIIGAGHFVVDGGAYARYLASSDDK